MSDPGLTDNEAREAAGIHLEANYWHRCTDLRDAGAIKDTNRVREGAFGLDRMVCVITPYGITLAEELLRNEFAMFPRPKPSARNSDPNTSHAAAANAKRKTRANSQMGLLLIEYLRAYRAWERSLS